MAQLSPGWHTTPPWEKSFGHFMVASICKRKRSFVNSATNNKSSLE